MADFERARNRNSEADRDLRTTQALFDDGWWRGRFGTLEGMRADRGYEAYEPALRYGWDSAHRHVGRRWDEVEDEVERGWEERRGNALPAWEEMRAAVHHAFDRAMKTFGRTGEE